MTESTDLSDEDQLALAIGRVAMQGAINDETLRRVITNLMSLSDSVYLLIEGQSTDWLCTTLPVVANAENYQYRKWTKERHEALLTAVQLLKALQPHRNVVVHSTWNKGVDPLEVDITQPRPWGRHDDSPSWSARRSRHRTYAAEAEWTVSNINLLVAKMKEARQELTQAWAAVAGWWEEHEASSDGDFLKESSKQDPP